MPPTVTLDESRVARAVKALMGHLTKEQQGSSSSSMMLLAEDRMVYLTVGLRATPEERVKKPVRIPLAHGLYDGVEGAETLLITKDPQSEYEKLLRAKGVGSDVKVMSVSNLRNKYKMYEAKRKLLGLYDCFLVDDRVAPLLPRLLGKKFFETKRRPAPVNMKRTNLSRELARARDATYLYITTGPCCAVRVGRVSQTPRQIVDNILLAAPYIFDGVPRKGRNILSVHVKADNSIALPLFRALPSATGAAGMSQQQEEEDATKAEEEAEEEEEKKKKKKKPASTTKAKKPTKRPAAPTTTELTAAAAPVAKKRSTAKRTASSSSSSSATRSSGRVATRRSTRHN